MTDRTRVLWFCLNWTKSVEKVLFTKPNQNKQEISSGSSAAETRKSGDKLEEGSRAWSFFTCLKVLGTTYKSLTDRTGVLWFCLNWRESEEKVLFTKPNQKKQKISSGSSAAETRKREDELAQFRSKHSLILMYLLKSSRNYILIRDQPNLGFMVLPELNWKWGKKFCTPNRTKTNQKYVVAAQ